MFKLDWSEVGTVSYCTVYMVWCLSPFLHGESHSSIIIFFFIFFSVRFNFSDSCFDECLFLLVLWLEMLA